MNDDATAYGCPECYATGGQVQQDVVPADAHILAFREEDGEPVPEWTGETELHYNGQHAADDMPQYRCTLCGAEYEEPVEVEP